MYLVVYLELGIQERREFFFFALSHYFLFLVADPHSGSVGSRQIPDTIPVEATVKISQLGRDLRRSVVLLPAQDRTGTKFRPQGWGDWGFLIGALRTETAKPPWAPAAVLSYPCSKMFSFEAFLSYFLMTFSFFVPWLCTVVKTLIPSSC